VPGDQPHPLGPRDVIETLAGWSRTIITAVIVVVVAVGAYLIGVSRDRLTILERPQATTGVLWHCSGQLSGVLRLPPGAATVVIGDERIRVDVDANGFTSTRPTARTIPDRVWVEIGGATIQVPVLDCVEKQKPREG
jgi:hypothetical protein